MPQSPTHYMMSQWQFIFCCSHPDYMYRIIWSHSILLQDLILTTVKEKRCGTAELAETKLLTILIYFTMTTVIVFTIESYISSVTPNLYLSALLPYFTCESTGYDESKDCTRLLSEVQQPHLFNLSVAFILIFASLPLVLFLFSTDFKLYVDFVKRVCKKLRGL